jgi:hypothetical protein
MQATFRRGKWPLTVISWTPKLARRSDDDVSGGKSDALGDGGFESQLPARHLQRLDEVCGAGDNSRRSM